MIDTAGRHPSTQSVARWFSSDHLIGEELRTTACMCEDLAVAMIREVPDSPELTTGLRKLLEARDCFLRAVIARGTP